MYVEDTASPGLRVRSGDCFGKVGIFDDWGKKPDFLDAPDIWSFEKETWSS